VTVGGSIYSNALGLDPVPPGVVTATVTRPSGECAGVFPVIVVLLTTVNGTIAVPPNVTLVAPVKLVPVIVTGVVPATGP